MLGPPLADGALSGIGGGNSLNAQPSGGKKVNRRKNSYLVLFGNRVGMAGAATSRWSSIYSPR